jgi:hypothetical protein
MASACNYSYLRFSLCFVKYVFWSAESTALLTDVKSICIFKENVRHKIGLGVKSGLENKHSRQAKKICEIVEVLITKYKIKLNE